MNENAKEYVTSLLNLDIWDEPDGVMFVLLF